jgi:hypothetical protein
VVKKFDAIPTSYLFIGNSLTGNNDGVHTHFEALMQDSSAPGNREALSLPDQSAEART